MAHIAVDPNAKAEKQKVEDERRRIQEELIK